MALDEQDLEQIKGLLSEGFAEERVHTRGIVREVVGDVVPGIVEDIVKREVGALSNQISNFIEYNFTPAIDSLQEQIGEIRRDMKRTEW